MGGGRGLPALPLAVCRSVYPLPLLILSKALPVFNLFPPVLSQSMLLGVCFPLLPPPLAGNTHLKCSGGTDKARKERGKAKQSKAACVTPRGR